MDGPRLLNRNAFCKLKKALYDYCLGKTKVMWRSFRIGFKSGLWKKKISDGVTQAAWLIEKTYKSEESNSETCMICGARPSRRDQKNLIEVIQVKSIVLTKRAVSLTMNISKYTGGINQSVCSCVKTLCGLY